MHAVQEKEEAMPQGWHVLPREPLQQWYVRHFFVFLHKNQHFDSICFSECSQQQYFFLGDCIVFVSQENIIFYFIPLHFIFFNNISILKACVLPDTF